MAVMAECWACGNPLDPAWRFCVRCGVPVERDEASAEPDFSEPGTIGPLAITGIVVGSVAALGIVVAIIALIVPA
jgi:hypothetical protein